METEVGGHTCPAQGLLSTVEARTLQGFPFFQARDQPGFLCQILKFSKVTNSPCFVVVFVKQPGPPKPVCGPWVPLSPASPVSPHLGTGRALPQPIACGASGERSHLPGRSLGFPGPVWSLMAAILAFPHCSHLSSSRSCYDGAIFSCLSSGNWWEGQRRGFWWKPWTIASQLHSGALPSRTVA